MPDGYGVATSIESLDDVEKTVYAGRFTKGNLIGPYIAWMNSELWFIGEGNLLKKEFIGKICYIQNNIIYEGRIDKSGKTGHGILTFPQGDRYEGSFWNDKKCGKGKIVYN